MKIKLIYVIAFILCVQIAKAQTFGIKGGVNFANMAITASEITFSPKSITGVHIGPVVDFSLNDKIYFNTGLLYSVKGFKLNVTGETETYTETLNYLEIPLNVALKFPISDKSKFFVEAGPYLAYALSGKDKVGGESIDIEFGTGSNKRFDAGLGFGAGVELGNIVASLNYQLGLANVLDVEGTEAKNKVFQISLAYMFGKKK